MMLVCGNAISQTDTKIKSKESCLVCIDTSIAKKIGNDLVSGDVCKAEIKLVRQNLKLIQKKVAFKDSVINAKDKQIDNFNLIIQTKDEQYKNQLEISKTYKSDLDKITRKSAFYKITTFIALLGGGVLYLTK